MGDATESAQPFLELNLAGGLTHKFETLDSFKKWLDEERKYWGWLVATQTQNLNNINCVGDTIIAYTNFFNQCASIVSQPPAQIPQQVRNFASQLSPRGPILRPSPYVTLMDELREYLRPGAPGDVIVGASAVIAANRVPLEANLPPNYLGHPICDQAIAYFELLKTGLTPAASRAVAQEMTKSTQTLSDALVRADHRVTELEQRCAAFLAKAGADNVELGTRLTDEAAASVERIDATNALYTKALQIKAPVEYWTDKATEHRRLARVYRWWLIGSGVAVLLAFFATYRFGWDMIGASVNKNPTSAVAIALYIAGFVAAVTAILLWAMRLVVRLYMSQHHLTIDADERAAMLKTFLALSEQEKVTEADLALVLAAVFRPTPDGIIRDDGAPTLSAGGLMSAMLDSRKA
jgi:hypothetical protein